MKGKLLRAYNISENEILAKDYEIAKDILASYNILNNDNETECSAYINAKCAIVYADTLIKLLKEHN